MTSADLAATIRKHVGDYAFFAFCVENELLDCDQTRCAQVEVLRAEGAAIADAVAKEPKLNTSAEIAELEKQLETMKQAAASAQVAVEGAGQASSPQSAGSTPKLPTTCAGEKAGQVLQQLPDSGDLKMGVLQQQLDFLQHAQGAGVSVVSLFKNKPPESACTFFEQHATSPRPWVGHYCGVMYGVLAVLEDRRPRAENYWRRVRDDARYKQCVEDFLKQLSKAQRKDLLLPRILTHLTWFFDCPDDARNPDRYDAASEGLGRGQLAYWLLEKVPPDCIADLYFDKNELIEYLKLFVQEQEYVLTALETKGACVHSIVDSPVYRDALRTLRLFCGVLRHGADFQITERDATYRLPESEWLAHYEQSTFEEMAKRVAISETALHRLEQEYERTALGLLPIVKRWKGQTLFLKKWVEREMQRQKPPASEQTATN